MSRSSNKFDPGFGEVHAVRDLGSELI